MLDWKPLTLLMVIVMNVIDVKKMATEIVAKETTEERLKRVKWTNLLNNLTDAIIKEDIPTKRKLQKQIIEHLESLEKTWRKKKRGGRVKVIVTEYKPPKKTNQNKIKQFGKKYKGKFETWYQKDYGIQSEWTFGNSSDAKSFINMVNDIKNVDAEIEK